MKPGFQTFCKDVAGSLLNLYNESESNQISFNKHIFKFLFHLRVKFMVYYLIVELLFPSDMLHTAVIRRCPINKVFLKI